MVAVVAGHRAHNFLTAQRNDELGLVEFNDAVFDHLLNRRRGFRLGGLRVGTCRRGLLRRNGQLQLARAIFSRELID